MAKVVHNRAVGHFRGELAGWVFRRLYGQSIITPAPEPRAERRRSAAEAQTNDRFRTATRYAKSVGPELRARYDARAEAENKSKFSIRTRDYLVPPKVSAVYLLDYTGQPGEPILVAAHDDFEVKQLTLTLRRTDGSMVESGPASPSGGNVFRYLTTAAANACAVRIEVIATDWAGNTTPWQTEWPLRGSS